jgi:hypothetical protein
VENIMRQRKTDLHDRFFTLQTDFELVGGDDHVEILSTGSSGDRDGNVDIGNSLPLGKSSLFGVLLLAGSLLGGRVWLVGVGGHLLSCGERLKTCPTLI